MKIRKRRNKIFTSIEKHNALKLLTSYNINDVAEYLHCTIQTLYRWKRVFDGTLKSLENNFHKHYHPNQHNEQEVRNILFVLNNVKFFGFNDFYTILKNDYCYNRNPQGLYNYLKRHNLWNRQYRRRYKRINKVYYTPSGIGEKWQVDVKYVPKCCLYNDDKQYFQYTCIDEATRQRFIYAYDKLSQYNTIDFIQRAIRYFGYKPKCIQTDNGQEFTNRFNIHLYNVFDLFCFKNNIEHKLIRPAMPRHNGKVERSHRCDQERFYNNLKFKNLRDLNNKLSKYLERVNNIVSSVLLPIDLNRKRIWMTPIEKRKELENLGLIS